jgi:hypothetical protein
MGKFITLIYLWVYNKINKYPNPYLINKDFWSTLKLLHPIGKYFKHIVSLIYLASI